MDISRVLILTAGFGEGHNAAARNLRDAISAANPEVRVEMRDVFAEAYGWLNRLFVRAYLFVINRLPGVWNLIFQRLDTRAGEVAGNIGVFGHAVKLTRSILDELQPEVVVSVYPGCSHLLDHIFKGAAERPFRQVTIVTDSLTINRVWHVGYNDFYLVPNEETAVVMRGQGVSAEKIRVTGFPVPAFFAAPRPPKLASQSGECWRVLFMVNSGKHIAVDVVRELLAIEGIELIVTVGRDEALEKRIRALTASHNAVQVHGWTKQLPDFIANAHVVISKAGGATVQECLAAVTPMIVSQVVPGQEEGNARLIVEGNAGAIAVTPGAIAESLRSAFASDGEIWCRWHAGAQRLSRPNASREIAEWLLNLK